MVSTTEGVVLAILILGLILFRPDLLAKLVKTVVGGVLGAVFNGIANAIGSNEQVITYLFMLALMLMGIIYMFRGLFKKGGGKSK